MRYLRIEWRCDDLACPTLLLSECDEDGWERRKIEIYRDGRSDRASEGAAEGGAILSLEPIPDVAEINRDRQFVASEISAAEFEAAWTGGAASR
ncbi:MAG TPA: hypothetical protein VMT68_04915 [Caulobacteraceae bacterium]|nr:hypothetical protein [Caulobacteraceae bacterium]